MKLYVAKLRHLRTGLFPLALGLVLTFGSLLLLSDSIQDSDHFAQLYSTLFAINVVILLVLLGLIGFNVARVLRQYRRRITGSRLTVRLVVIFVVLSLLPVSVVYYVAYRFINYGLDSWFDVRVEHALESSLNLSRSALDVQLREITEDLKATLPTLANLSDAALAARLLQLRSDLGASELTVVTNVGRVIAHNSADPSRLVPDRLDDALLMQVRTSDVYAGLEPRTVDGSINARIAVRLPSARSLSEFRILHGLFPISDRMSSLANQVQGAYGDYKELTFQRAPLKFSFTLTLSLVLLLSVLAAVWAAFVSAQRLVDPIRVLSLGTRAVAEGNYDKRLTPQTHDELGALVESFNDMTQRISAARDEARRSQYEAESGREYLKAVLGSLSSGVLTFDEKRVLRTANAAAEKILGADVQQVINSSLEDIAKQYSHLEAFAGSLQERMAKSEVAWEAEIPFVGSSGRRVLLCRGRSLPADQDNHVGHVVVFDDITALLQAERDAAWREVARRIAHEIKNPLTPIQLSAERLRHKYLESLDPAGAEVLDRSTRTIIAQVESLKQMVKAFSEYARMPRLEPVALNINSLVNEVLDLYRIGEHDIQFDVELDPAVENIEADPARLRQVLHNLVRNALEAMRDTAEAKIRIATRWFDEDAQRGVELRVEDSGPGIPEELMANLFEPYVTTKPKGAGLGLAIVKRIVDEHGGKLWAANCAEGGAGIYVRLPAESVPKLSSINNKRAG